MNRIQPKYTEPVYVIKPEFDKIYNSMLTSPPLVEKRTWLSKARFRILYELAITTSFLEGQVAEAGSWAGAVVFFLASMLPDKQVHGFDTWEGYPELTIEDSIDGNYFHSKGWLAVPEPIEYLARFDNVTLHKGMVENTLVDISDQKFCLVHVDVNLYSAYKQCIDFFVTRMVEGGFMVFDDYLHAATPGATRAIDQWLGDNTDREIWLGDKVNLIVRF